MKKVLHCFGVGDINLLSICLLKAIILKQIADDKESMQHYHTGKESGGVQVRPTKKALTYFFLFFLVLSLFYRSQMVNFKGFQGSRGGPTFSRGGGSNCLFPIETHITCDFPGGVQTSCPPPPPPPPLDPHL